MFISGSSQNPEHLGSDCYICLTCRIVGHIPTHLIWRTLGIQHASHAINSLAIGRASSHHSSLVNVRVTRWPKSNTTWLCTIPNNIILLINIGWREMNPYRVRPSLIENFNCYLSCQKISRKEGHCVQKNHQENCELLTLLQYIYCTSADEATDRSLESFALPQLFSAHIQNYYCLVNWNCWRRTHWHILFIKFLQPSGLKISGVWLSSPFIPKSHF